MATWIGAQQRRLLASHVGTLDIGGQAALGLSSLDHYGAVRVLALSLHSSYELLVQQGAQSGTWLVSTAQALSVGSGQALEYTAAGAVGNLVATMGDSASMLRLYAYAVPVT